jgi:hypothetical protein
VTRGTDLYAQDEIQTDKTFAVKSLSTHQAVFRPNAEHESASSLESRSVRLGVLEAVSVARSPLAAHHLGV